MNVDWIDVPMKDTTSSSSVSHIIDTYTNPIPRNYIPAADYTLQTVQSELTSVETQGDAPDGKARKVRPPNVSAIRI